ncbi:receptor activity-modifying protein 2 [Pygocentrus nattereri]|uniref:Receptor (G protein-coupled) activity modifying protein 2 n=1 Tax=Pygocentrus nattereri TaxID=42514 RepID=A0AAR2JFG7_PYGNA|nr:receptor activity-modifying protein 2 [Pygocentrus nattereri]
MDLLRPSPCIRPVWRAPFWVACMALMFSGLHALIPNGQKNLVRTTLPVLPGVQTTPLTTISGSFEASSSGDSLIQSSFPCGNVSCYIYCNICEEDHLPRTRCYEDLIQGICSFQFMEEMKAMNRSSWCVWDEVKSPYNTLTQCTENIADCLLLPWPNKLVEQIFVDIHTSYFQECPTETLRDPPPNVIFALVMTPICLIPAMVVLVVLKTKNGDRRS